MPDDDSPKLRICPFCGANDSYILDANTVNGKIFFACCQPCGACGPDADNVCAAVSLWNKRRKPRRQKPKQSPYNGAKLNPAPHNGGH